MGESQKRVGWGRRQYKIGVNRPTCLRFSRCLFKVDVNLKPQAESLLFAAVLLLLQPIQIEEVDRVLQSAGRCQNKEIRYAKSA